MTWSRGLALALALVLLPNGTRLARSQGSGSGSGTGAPPPEETDDDEGAGDGSGSALVAPKELDKRPAWLRDKLAEAIAARPTLAGASIGYVIHDLKTNTAVATRDPDKPKNLASNVKLLTAIAALTGLGGGFRWRTAVYTDVDPDPTGKIAGDLYVRGRGDPTLTVAGLEQLAHDVAARGIRTIEGKLVLDTSYFDASVEPPHYEEQPKERAAFRAPVASFGVNRSAITITVMANPDGTASVTYEPKVDFITIAKAEVTSVTTGRTRLRFEQKLKRDKVELEITGQIRYGEGSWDLRRRVDDPARFAAEIFRKALARQGVKIHKPKLGSAAVPLTAKLVAHHDSPPLLDVVRAMNKHSDNYVAESIVKTLGAELKGTAGPASWDDGLAQMRAQLAKLGLAATTYRVGNGSGLYAASEVTPEQLVALLAAAHADYRIGPDLVASLPLGGHDGTLSRRWHGKPARGRVRAKTGTLDKVITLGGFIAVEPGHVVAFAILVNDIPPKERRTTRLLIDEMVDAMAAYLGAQ